MTAVAVGPKNLSRTRIEVADLRIISAVVS